MSRILGLCTSLWLVLLCGCSVDRGQNPQYLRCSECKRRGGSCITQDYCLLPAGGARTDASLPDASGPSEACAEEGAVEFCYEAEDKSSALQPPCHAGNRSCHGGVWSACDKQVVPREESCNHVDDDCDGQVDEALPPSDCDVPDKQGACQKGVQVCNAGELQCLQKTFARADTCNGEDDDCDGNTDEGTQLRCYPADTLGCTPSSTRDGGYDCTGRCATGTRACMNGAYSDTCEGAVTPDTNERCTDPGGTIVDDDCDGQKDEGCTCKAGSTCYDGPAETQVNGPCHAGKQVCSDATHGSCQGQVTPGVEDCSNDGVDDDCDGVKDNIPARGMSCMDSSAGQGTCKADATWQCRDGKQVCVDAAAGTETCDGQGHDEDCDGKVDEGFDRQTDENNCGTCGNVCGAGLSCCAGGCVDPQASKANCGACGNACAGAETCCSGTCINTGSSAQNCGACGNACPLLNSCSSGSCKLL